MGFSSDPSFWPQILVLAVGCLDSFGSGIILAYPGALNAAIVSPNATEIKATTEQSSWIASAYGFSGLISLFIFSPVFQIIGRKPVNIIFNIIVILGWILLYFSKSVTALIVAKSIQGLALGGVYVAMVTFSEYAHCKKRGLFMSLKKTSTVCGSLFCHSLTLIWDWRQIALVSFVPNAAALFIIIFCPESLAFYAIKGRFEDCVRSFMWFHGDSHESKTELRQLISAQMVRIKSKQHQTKTPILLKLLKKLLRRDFFIPFFIATLAVLAVDASGRYFLLGYITEIMIKLIGDTNIAVYCSIIADCLLIIALFTSSIVIRSFKRRTVIFGFGTVSVILMFIIGLIDVTLVLHARWVTPCLILLHSFISHIGVIPAAFIVTTEIFPLNHRGMGSLATGIIFTLFYAVTMKIIPLLIEKTSIGGAYLIFGICVTLSLITLYFILPETKDKTLQEIEDEIKGVKRTDADIELALLNNSTKSTKSVIKPGMILSSS